MKIKNNVNLQFSAGEHVSATTKKYLKSIGVHYYFTASKMKAPQAERYAYLYSFHNTDDANLSFRFIKTIRVALRRFRAANNTTKWMHAVKEIVKNYNLTKSRAHGEIPSDVMTSKQAAWRALCHLLRQRSNKNDFLDIDHLPKVGQFVRLSRIKGPFEKESNEVCISKTLSYAK